MKGHAEVTVTMGGVEATAHKTIYRTLLGSCISVCLWDERARVGGMNHFMLPQGPAAGGDPARFGVHAMALLIGAIQRAGGQRERLVAKIFGGGAVLSGALNASRVPQMNIEFIEGFMKLEQIKVLARDLGGTQARQVKFLTDSGHAYVKKLGAARQVIVREEKKIIKPVVAPPAYGEVELWA